MHNRYVLYIFFNLYLIEGSGGVHVYIILLIATYFLDDSAVVIQLAHSDLVSVVASGAWVLATYC